MSKLTEIKIDHIKKYKNNVWYAMQHNADFPVQCMLAQILEKWDNNSDVTFADYVKEQSRQDEYKNFLSEDIAYKALRVSEQYGIIKRIGKSDYNSNQLTDLYFELKRMCDNDFSKREIYQAKIDEILFEMLLPIGNADSSHKIYAAPYAVKVLLCIGDINGNYSVSIQEFKKFIATSTNWYQYAETAAGILEYRDNNHYKSQVDEIKIKDSRAHNYIQNLSYIRKDGSNLCLDMEGISTIRNLIATFETTHILEDDQWTDDNENDLRLYLQKIYYGAPGTGKSNEIKQLTGEGKDGIKFSKDFTFRTTFHPDSDYSSFVGAYKPIWNGTKIIYDFRPQTFLKAYIAAWTNPHKNVALVIEEINRGNCAQIFGDIFQLLDRESNGLSKYPIEADIDMQDCLRQSFVRKNEDGSETLLIGEKDKEEINSYYSNHYDNAFDKIKSGMILALPKNLSLLATMNTSDQSLFPMDSAFKRRWSWEYMPIKDAHKEWKIQLDKSHELIDWWEFLKRINVVVSDLTTSEDKQLGYFFCQPDEFVEDMSDSMKLMADPNMITAKQFVDKVIFYLWNDVFKDYAFDAPCCKGKDDKEVLFAKFYNEDVKSVNIDTLTNFFESLKTDDEESLVKTKKSNAD